MGTQDMTGNISSRLKVDRKPIQFLSDHTRVISRLFRPGNSEQIRNVVREVAKLSARKTSELLNEVLAEFANRHRNIENVFMDHYSDATDHLQGIRKLSREKKLLVGSYFTMEYSIEAAALFNPSIMYAPDQENLPPGHSRVIMSFRATGEGHVSSIQLRNGTLTNNNQLVINAVRPHLETPHLGRNMFYDKNVFGLQLLEIGMPDNSHAPRMGSFLLQNEILSVLLEKLNATFTLENLQEAMSWLRGSGEFAPDVLKPLLEHIRLFACSNYEARFPLETDLSERILFPVSENERRGIEDARFVRFVDDDGEITYYATYFAFDGETGRTQLLETRDFLNFRISTLNGEHARSKGLALFPRKINGKYFMISRIGGSDMCLLRSDDIRFWHTAKKIPYNPAPWEYVQIGNCGSPIETEAGWLVITHGVGAVRRYCIGAMLLDRNDPSVLLGKLDKPLLAPVASERNGYVPNVVYTCGSLVHNDELIIPYAMSDSASSVATINLQQLLNVLLEKYPERCLQSAR